jgi:uncharacterized protein YacL
MKTWQGLYAMVWVAFLEFLLVMTGAAFPATRIYLVPAHVTLGAAIIWFAYGNFTGLLASRVPGRVKRIAKSTLQMSIAAAVIGALMGVFLLAGLRDAFAFPFIGITIYNVFQFFHAVVAFAIITQAAAAAIGYDMWEEREWEKETQPGEVPPNPNVPVAAAQKA